MSLSSGSWRRTLRLRAGAHPLNFRVVLPGSGTFPPRSGVVGGSNGRICVTAPLQDAFTDPVSDPAEGGATRASAADASQAQRATLLERRQELARIGSALADAALGSRPVRSSRRSCRHWQDRAAGGGAARGDRRRHARASCTRHGDGAGLRFRCCPAAFRASIGRCVRHRSLGSVARGCRCCRPHPRAPGRSRARTRPKTPRSIRPSQSCTGSTGCARTSPLTSRLCLIVDDAHWMDGPSPSLLSFLLTRLDELQVALVLATRPSEPGVGCRAARSAHGRSCR